MSDLDRPPLKVILIDESQRDHPVVFLHECGDYAVDLCICFTQAQVDDIRNVKQLRSDVIWPEES